MIRLDLSPEDVQRCERTLRLHANGCRNDAAKQKNPGTTSMLTEIAEAHDALADQLEQLREAGTR